jgi:hypothetical protein
MTIQAQWSDRKFEITSKQLKMLESFSASYKIKKKQDGTSDKYKLDGHELQSFSLSYTVSPIVGIDALKEYQTMRSYLGKTAPLLVENALFGPNYLMLEKVSLNADSISPSGIILSGTITLELKEYQTEGKQTAAKGTKYSSPIKKAKKSEEKSGLADIGLKILYNDKDITDDISVSSCIHDMFASSQADTLCMKFNDSKRLWDKWQPTKKDTISISYGIAKTGTMFIDSVIPENGVYTLRASSIPPTAMNKTDKSWENVHLMQLAQEIAKRHGLGFESYDVADKIYSYVRQPNIPDFEFLQQRCNLEGLAFVVYDKKLVLYDEEKLETATPVKEVNLTTENDFTYTDSSQKGYGKAIVTNGDLTGEFISSNGLENALTQTISTSIGGQAEANRFAKGLLRQANKNLTQGIFKLPLMREFSAGSVMKIKTAGANTWDGNGFVSHIRQDYIKSTSKVFFRKAVA